MAEVNGYVAVKSCWVEVAVVHLFDIKLGVPILEAKPYLWLGSKYVEHGNLRCLDWMQQSTHATSQPRFFMLYLAGDALNFHNFATLKKQNVPYSCIQCLHSVGSRFLFWWGIPSSDDLTSMWRIRLQLPSHQRWQGVTSSRRLPFKIILTNNYAGPARSFTTCSSLKMALTQDELKKMVGYKVITSQTASLNLRVGIRKDYFTQKKCSNYRRLCFERQLMWFDTLLFGWCIATLKAPSHSKSRSCSELIILGTCFWNYICNCLDVTSMWGSSDFMSNSLRYIWRVITSGYSRLLGNS